VLLAHRGIQSVKALVDDGFEAGAVGELLVDENLPLELWVLGVR
jgi:hypothetical protein